jgi:hypothetical protein
MQSQKQPKTIKNNQRIDPSQNEALERAVRFYGLSRSEITRAALNEYLSSLGFMKKQAGLADE